MSSSIDRARDNVADFLRRMQFTRHDLANIVLAPRKAAKAYGAAAVTAVIDWLTSDGALEWNTLLLAGAAFALAWLVPNRE